MRVPFRRSSPRERIASLGIAIAIVVLAVRSGDGSAGESVWLAVVGFALWSALLVGAAAWSRYQRWRDDRWWGRR